MSEIEGRDSDAPGRETDPEDNVVRFPRDWFGPVEELVPIGPRAGLSAVATPGADVPAAAEDFWGEGSAAVQQLIEAPALPDRVRRPRPALRALHALAALPLLGRRQVAAACAVCAVAGLAVIGSTEGGSRLRGPSAHGSQMLLASSPAISPLLPVVRPSRPTATRHVARPVHHRAHVAHSAAAVAHGIEVTDVRSSAVAASDTGGPASSRAAAARAPAGPVGPGAAFAPGQMG